MKITNSEILHFLEQHPHWQSAKTLANQFGVTPRTIRNRITKINQENQIIESSPLGYRVKSNTLSVSPDVLDSESMKEQLFNLLFRSPNGSLRMTEILESTYYSELTIQSVISKFNKDYANMNVQIQFRKGTLYLVGSEFDQRKLFHYFAGKKLKSFSQSSIFSLGQLIPGIPVESLRQIITDVINQKDLVINGYEINYLLLHYGISINRIKNGNSYQSFKAKENLREREEYRLTKEITSRISQLYYLEFNQYEIEALTLALIGKTIVKDIDNQQLADLEHYVSEEIIAACLKVVANTNQAYQLQLNDPQFLVRFIIHVNNMIDRVAYDQHQVTEGFEYLSTQYPLLHEISLFVLSELSKILKTEFPQSESTYLLIHLGSYLENVGHNSINTVLVAPRYQLVGGTIEERIMKNFHEDLSITKVIDDNSAKIKDIDSKLILTTTDIAVHSDNFIVKISPMVTNFDTAKIRQVIGQIKHEDRVKRDILYLKKYTAPELFYPNMNFKSKATCLEFGAKKLGELGYTSGRYLEEVLQRENLAATNFESVAIPHTMKMTALKTGFLFMIDPQGVTWSGEAKCQLIIMLALNQDTVHIFGDLLQSLVSVLSVKQNVNQLIKKENYSDFLQCLSEQIKGDYQAI